MTRHHLGWLVEHSHIPQGPQKYPRGGNFLEEWASFILWDEDLDYCSVATDDWKGIGVGREEGRSAGFHRLNDLIWHSVDNTGFPWWLSGKESICQCRKLRFDPWAGKIPWRRKWQPTPLFCPRKSHDQRSLAGYSPWGHKRVRIPLSD